MPEETAPSATPESAPQESLGWRAGLPDPLKSNDAFKPFKTVGDFANAHLETTKKLTDAETRLKDSIPKLPNDATDEDRKIYFDALGRPEKAADYEFDGEDKNAPEWTSFWKQQFHELGLTKAQGKSLSAKWDGQIQKMVDAYNNGRKQEVAAAETKLRSELGDKFDANVELAKRMWTKYGEGDFDKAFAQETSATRMPIMRMILKLAALTGEDRSPQGMQSRSPAAKADWITYDKSPAPPHRM